MRKSSRRMPTVGQFTADKGIYISSEIFKRYMRDLGFTWVPTMSIGSGRRVHLRADELPPGRLVVKISRHCSAVIRHARFFARRHALSLRLLEAGVIAREPQKPACEH
jgi:hypothetical protein